MVWCKCVWSLTSGMSQWQILMFDDSESHWNYQTLWLFTDLWQAHINFQRFQQLLNTFLFRCWDHGTLSEVKFHWPTTVPLSKVYRFKTRLKSELDLTTEIWSKNILRPNLGLSKVLRLDLSQELKLNSEAICWEFPMIKDRPLVLSPIVLKYCLRPNRGQVRS